MLTDSITILIQAAGDFMRSVVNIVLTATPMFGVPVFVLMMGFIVLLMGWITIHEGG